MIRVRVELVSAITGKTTELARMHIWNTGERLDRRRNYSGRSFIGRNKTALDRCTPGKEGSVSNYPSQSLHVWNLVTRMLIAMGYTK